MKIVAYILLSAAMIVVLVFARIQGERDQKERDALTARVDRFCNAQRDELRTIVHLHDTDGLYGRLPRLTDPAASRLCLGVDVPTDGALRTAADRCWVTRGEHACYLDLVTALLALYDRR